MRRDSDTQTVFIHSLLAGTSFWNRRTENEGQGSRLKVLILKKYIFLVEKYFFSLSRGKKKSKED